MPEDTKTSRNILEKESTKTEMSNDKDFVTGDLVAWTVDVSNRDNDPDSSIPMFGIVLENSIERRTKIVKVYWPEKSETTWCFRGHLVRLS